MKKGIEQIKPQYLTMITWTIATESAIIEILQGRGYRVSEIGAAIVARKYDEVIHVERGRGKKMVTRTALDVVDLEIIDDIVGEAEELERERE